MISTERAIIVGILPLLIRGMVAAFFAPWFVWVGFHFKGISEFTSPQKPTSGSKKAAEATMETGMLTTILG